MNNPLDQEQDVEETLQNAHCAINRGVLEESGDTVPLARTEPTWNNGLETGESGSVQDEGKILCYHSDTKLIWRCHFRRSYAF
jgi:hypothetical protein